MRSKRACHAVGARGRILEGGTIVSDTPRLWYVNVYVTDL
jgi:hypothetical protein